MADKIGNTVDLIDPMESVTNLPNGTPEYEKMFIFAELLGRRRERSVLTLNSNDKQVSLETVLSNTNVNMMGVDFNEETPNSSSFTTKWTDNNTNQTKTLEGFGITNITVKINSSFIPVINIDFIDIRGMTFFNLGENSPYSILFDFPPPIFDLTLKGYYGKSLTYQLHLLKHNTKFDSKTGNYHINVEFVARTFAPLADIPFKYVELLSLMYNNTQDPVDIKVLETGMQDNINPTNQNELNFDPRVAPKNTYELVKKFQQLTDELKNLNNTSKEAKEFKNAKVGTADGVDILIKMNQFSSQIDPIFQDNAKIIIQQKNIDYDTNTEDNGGDFRIVKNVETYSEQLQGDGTVGDNSNNQNSKLYLAVLTNKVRDDNVGTQIEGQTKILTESLLSYSQSLYKKGEIFNNDIKRSDISEPVSIVNDTPEDGFENSADIYIGIDITKFYTKFDLSYNKKIALVDNAQSNLVKLVNSKLKKILGFNPTIYNIFKVLCDDIDTFFKVLGEVTYSAEIHHNKKSNYSKIINNVQEVKSKKISNKLHAFPLYIEEDVTCNVVKKVRRIPDFPSLDEPFPETTFIDKFINLMIKIRKQERVNDMKSKIDINGNHQWIPITPVDSKLHLNENSNNVYDSPYAKLYEGKNTSNVVIEIYRRLLNRFYIASQFTYGEIFYNQEKNTNILRLGDNDLKRDDYIKFIAKSEAINLANSLIENDLLESLITKSKVFKIDAKAFYTELEVLPQYTSIGDSLLLTDDTTELYRDRRNINYQGMEILPETPALRRAGDDSDPIGRFLNDDEEKLFPKISKFFNPKNEKQIKSFTIENIPYYPDYDDDTDNNDIYTTKYLNNIELQDKYKDDEIFKYDEIYDTPYIFGAEKDKAGKEADGNFVETLTSICAIYSDEVINFITGSTYNADTKAFVLASLFGRARSYFSKLGYNDFFTNVVGSVNSRFATPGVVEVPKFSIYYMGALVEYTQNTNLQNEINLLIEEPWFNHISVLGKYIEQDVGRIGLLSLIDKQTFNDAYKKWQDPNFNAYLRYSDDLRFLISEFNIKKNGDPEKYKRPEDLQDLLEELIKEDGLMQSIQQDMMAYSAILNYSEYTFKIEDISEDISGDYIPLEQTNLDIHIFDGPDKSKRSANDLFFKTFWNKIGSEAASVLKELKEIDKGFIDSIEDNDIKTQLYYSFKNISDKWIAGINTRLKGFPLNHDENDPLISKFAFVDRAMNPIGDDIIINAEAIIEMSKDFDLNMFQVFSRLLSQNGFEFFPLQNFMSFNAEDGAWADSFKLQTTLEQKATPAFVCMYIGGTSSILENPVSAFDNDGILDLEGEGIPDFNNNDGCSKSKEVIGSKNRSRAQGEARFKYSEPKAFRVRFGEQNQSFFTDIQLEGRDFTETTDSLAILSRIAGDKTTAPIPKGQNLFNLYENRAYSVKIKMFGNVMIQPTQYFQLENIPMYSGAYMILSVTHTVTPNHIVTEFEGVKVLKFPNPYVKDFATIVGIEGGTSQDLSATRSLTTGGLLSADALPNKELLTNDMFDLSISP